MSVADLLRARLRALASAGRIGQFVSVGVAGAALETLLVALLTAGFVIDPPLAGRPLVAKAIGAEASITLMFLLNDNWTFAGHGGAGPVALVRRWAKSHLVRSVGLGVAFATLYVLTSWTDVRLVIAGGDIWPTIANAIGIGVGLGINYVAESLVTWRVHEPEL